MISRRPSLRSALLACCLGLAWAVAGTCGDYSFPEKPTEMVMDKAGLLLPEKAAALNSHLLAGAQEHGIWVYVLTLHSLEVGSSKQHARLSRLAHRYVDLWARDRLAIVILFDDESRDAIVAASPETDRQFPPWSRNLLLAGPLAQITTGEELTREKVDKAARLTLATMIDLHQQAQAKARQQRIVNGTMAVFFTVSGALILYGSLRKRRTGATPPAP